MPFFFKTPTDPVAKKQGFSFVGQFCLRASFACHIGSENSPRQCEAIVIFSLECQFYNTGRQKLDETSKPLTRLYLKPHLPPCAPANTSLKSYTYIDRAGFASSQFSVEFVRSRPLRKIMKQKKKTRRGTNYLWACFRLSIVFSFIQAAAKHTEKPQRTFFINHDKISVMLMSQPYHWTIANHANQTKKKGTLPVQA